MIGRKKKIELYRFYVNPYFKYFIELICLIIYTFSE